MRSIEKMIQSVRRPGMLSGSVSVWINLAIFLKTKYFVNIILVKMYIWSKPHFSSKGVV